MSFNMYPFESKSEIVSRINADTEYALKCLLVLDRKQTMDEQFDLVTRYKNARGWQSSHAKWGSVLAAKVRSGETLTPEEMGRAVSMTARYGRQLAIHFRMEAIEANPDLAEVARKFSAA